jgi:hypothetical protein
VTPPAAIAQPIKATASPRREVRPLIVPKVEISRAKTAIELVDELATDGWRRTAADRLSAYLDSEAGALLDRSWKADRCKKLAKAARKIAQLSGQFTILDGVLASQSARAAAAGSDLATALLSQAISLHSPTDTIVRGLRACGISLCVAHGCVGSCQCLKDLVEDTALPQLQNVIDEAIDRFLVVSQEHR